MILLIMSLNKAAKVIVKVKVKGFIALVVGTDLAPL